MEMQVQEFFEEIKKKTTRTLLFIDFVNICSWSNEEQMAKKDRNVHHLHGCHSEISCQWCYM